MSKLKNVGLAALLIGASALASGCVTINDSQSREEKYNHLREVAYTSNPEAYKPGIKPNGKIDFGDNCLKEANYVKTHFWTVPLNQKGSDPWTVHIERGIFDKSYSGFKGLKEHGISNGKIQRRVDFNNDNLSFDPYESEIGLEEYIKLDNGTALGVLVLEEGVLYRFYDQEGFTTFRKEEIDSNQNVLSNEQKNLYNLAVLNDKDLGWIKNLRVSEGKYLREKK